MTPAWTLLASYLIGSVPFGYLIAKIGAKRDIRSAGSGNIGATNVTRVVGKAAGMATLLLDLGKGFLAVWVAARFTGEDIQWMILAALGAIAGHLFPVWLGLRGGRGVATGAGAFLPVCWPAVLGALLIWLVVVLLWRYVSLGSIVAAAVLPLLLYFLYAPGHAPPLVVSLGASVASALIIIKHRPNIRRLLAGTESRLTLRR